VNVRRDSQIRRHSRPALFDSDHPLDRRCDVAVRLAATVAGNWRDTRVWFHGPVQFRDEPMSTTLARVTRDVRSALGWTQRELAARVRVSQSEVSRIETGTADSIEAVDRVLGELACRWTVARPRVDARLDQRDPAHARCTAYVRARLESMGYVVHQEVEIGDGAARGWIDILAFHPLERILHVGEIKTELRDVGGVQRQLGWYERAAVRAGLRFGWRPRAVVVGLYLLLTEANDEALRLNREAMRQAFPIRAGRLVHRLRTAPTPGARQPWAIALIDPLSRRRDWARSARADGRKSPARYRSYADFMVRWRESGRRHRVP